MSLKFTESKKFKLFMNYVYGWGAAVVIIGALFKIMHFPGASYVLTGGMLVEAFIFFLSPFDPQIEHYEWSNVFPELNKENTDTENAIYKKIRYANKKYNNWLKRLAEEVGIEKKVTCHIARHSFGNISGDKIPIQMLQKLYRHSDITTTINYQQAFINKDTDDALELVIGSDDE